MFASLEKVSSSFENFVTRGLKQLYPRYGLKESDIILATFPKSGTTWIRFIFANIISLKELNGVEIDYDILNGELGTSFEANRYPKIKYSALPRVIATHLPYDAKYFHKNGRIYLYRNPGDTMVSYFEYMKARIKEHQYKNSFKEFIRDEKYGINKWCNHVKDWLKQADIIITYEDLKNDSFNTIRNIFLKFNINNISDETIRCAIERSSFKNIRKIESEKGPGKRAQKNLKGDFFFARKGEIGTWKNYFDQEDTDYLLEKLNEYNLLNNIKTIEKLDSR